MPPPGLPLDHVVVVVPDLDDAAGALTDLGFLVTATSHHPFGTSNRIVMLDNSYVELISVTDPTKVPEDGFARYVAEALAAGRLGPRLLAFRSEGTEDDYARLSAAGLTMAQPLRFGRDAVLGDGSTVPVEFVVALPDFTASPYGAFVCQHLTPEAIWHPSVLAHANGAGRLLSVALPDSRREDWHLVSQVASATGPPFHLPNLTLEAGPAELVITAAAPGVAVLNGTIVRLVAI